MNYYELLGVTINASEQEIKDAYKREIKKWHPDINKDEEAVSITMKLNEAKDTLLDKEKRLEYDNFIIHKEDEIYNKYTNNKKEEYNVEIDSQEYDDYSNKYVTKWEYFAQYLRASQINLFRRIIATILVLLETFLCFLLKCFIILVSFICFMISDLIIVLFKMLIPIFVIIIGYLLFILISKGYVALVTNNGIILNSVIIYIIISIGGIILRIIGSKLISQKMFELLYNKFDVFLFKKAVGYRN